MQVETLVRKSQAGDRESFGKLYDLFARKIYAYLYYRTYHRETAEDLASLVFLKALEKLNTFRPEVGNFSSWIYRIARNTLYDYYRERPKAAILGDVWDAPDSTDIALDAENRDQWEKLKPYLAQLTTEQREIILMRLWDDLPYREIARILGKSEASCKMAFSRALVFLRESMPVSLYLTLLLWKIVLER